MKIAIDPGASGGIAIQNEHGIVNTWSMPNTIEGMSEILRKGKVGETTVYLEYLVKYTGFKMPSSMMAVYASNWGMLFGIAYTLGYDVRTVQPKLWQHVLSIKKEKGEATPAWKNRLKAKATELYPQLKVTLKNADALLILEAANLGGLD